MKTLKDKQGCAYLGKDKKELVAVVKSEYLKQAIKDLKSKVNSEAYDDVIFWIDKIFGVWEEINSEKTARDFNLEYEGIK